MAHEVKLEVFQGPIDLLLHLITKQRVDIYDVSISSITDEYVTYLARIQDLDLETATGFLVVAATLLELKSARLLPSRDPDDIFDARLLEERDLLLARLVECATFREAGTWLQVGLERASLWHPRSVALEEPYTDLVPDLLLKITIADLVRAASLVFEPKPQPQLDISHVRPIRASVRDAILDMLGLLRTGQPIGFAALCGGTATRIDVVVRFLGLLELYKAGAVEISQHDRFGDIVASWTGETDIDEVLADVEEYTLTAEESS